MTRVTSTNLHSRPPVHETCPIHHYPVNNCYAGISLRHRDLSHRVQTCAPRPSCRRDDPLRASITVLLCSGIGSLTHLLILLWTDLETRLYAIMQYAAIEIFGRISGDARGDGYFKPRGRL